MAKYNPDRLFGLEIEVVTNKDKREVARAISEEFTRQRIDQVCEAQEYNHNTQSIWKVVRDSSVRGWEIVSPPMKGHQGRIELEAVCKALNDLEVKVNHTTGLHVHHDARDLTGQQVGMTFGLYASFQHVFNLMVSPSRRNNNFARPLNWTHLTQNGRDNFRGEVRNASRRTNGNSIERKLQERMNAGGLHSYTSVDCMSLYRHGTIEFRQHQGTTNATKIWNWVLMTQSIIEAAREKRIVPKPSSITGKSYPRGEFSRFEITTAISPCYHVRAKNEDFQCNPNAPSIQGACTDYVEAYRYYAKLVKQNAQMAEMDTSTLR
jgi:hypothetical protein